MISAKSRPGPLTGSQLVHAMRRASWGPSTCGASAGSPGATRRSIEPLPPRRPGRTLSAAMASPEEVLFQVDEGVGVVTLNRPERLNAIHRGMAAGLVELFREIR